MIDWLSKWWLGHRNENERRNASDNKALIVGGAILAFFLFGTGNHRR
jgi:hypothetical protein